MLYLLVNESYMLTKTNTMSNEIVGDRNIANTGLILGDCTVDNTIVNSNFTIINRCNLLSMEEDGNWDLVNMTKAQSKMIEAIEKLAQAELVRAESGKIREEADKLRAEADNNNSIANLNYSKIIIENQEILKQLIGKL